MINISLVPSSVRAAIKQARKRLIEILEKSIIFKTVLRALGIVSVRWNNSVLPWFDHPAVFTGQDGKKYSFNDVYNAIKQLSDWR